MKRGTVGIKVCYVAAGIITIAWLAVGIYGLRARAVGVNPIEMSDLLAVMGFGFAVNTAMISLFSVFINQRFNDHIKYLHHK